LFSAEQYIAYCIFVICFKKK